MNREDENLKEATVSVSTDIDVTFHFKSGGHGTYSMGFAFNKVPVSASDKAIEASVVDEIENIYIKKQTIRAADSDKKTCIFDTEDISFIAIEKVQITRGDKNE
jgi:hypothetical protein